jgi:hypothetical protein
MIRRASGTLAELAPDRTTINGYSIETAAKLFDRILRDLTGTVPEETIP